MGIDTWAPFLSVGLLFFTAFVLTIVEDWRLATGALVFQYLGVFMLVSLSWPLEMAAVKLVAGAISAAVLAMGRVNLARLSFELAEAEDPERPLPPVIDEPGAGLRRSTEQVFRGTAVLLAALVAYALAAPVQNWIPALAPAAAWGALVLLGVGLLQITLSADTFRIFLGLLTFFSGFEILHAALERSLLIAGLFSAVTLGLALAAAYLILAPVMDE